MDKVIVYPASSRPLPKKVLDAPHATAFFYGGAAKKLGTGGFVVFGGDGRCVKEQASYYGEDTPTNNKAEAKALEELMAWLASHRGEWEGAPAIIIYGDS